MKRIFKNRSIRQKLLISSIIITLVPMVILELVFIFRTKDLEYEREIASANATADKLIYDYSFEMEKAELVAGTLAEFQPLNFYITGTFDTPSAARDYYHDSISPMIAPHNNVKSGLRIRVYHNDDSKTYPLEISGSLREFTKKNFTGDPFTSARPFWASVDCDTYHPVLSYFRPVFDAGTYKNIAYVVAVHIKESLLYSYIKGESAGERVIVVTDRNGYVITSTVRDYVGAVFSGIAEETESGLVLSGERYEAIERENENICVHVLISSDALNRQLARSALQILLIGISLFVISLLLIYYITGKATAGMEELIKKMNHVDRTKIHTMAKDPTEEGSRDEIVQLDSAFTKMMQVIDELVEQVKADEARLKDEVITRQQAELRFLQQQINPHYLFNTLESIRMKLILKNDREDANIVKLFAESFRRYIDMKNETSTLREEMSFIEKYIFIQNYRLEKKVNYELMASESTLSCMVPKLLIQPVVENAVIHGIEPKDGPGNITVTIARQGETIVIKVVDDGNGIEKEKLRELREHVYGEENGGSIGLQNVYRRIRLIYGEKGNMFIESGEGTGTKVTLILTEVRDV